MGMLISEYDILLQESEILIDFVQMMVIVAKKQLGVMTIIMVYLKNYLKFRA
jgi:hypothetical protein